MLLGDIMEQIIKKIIEESDEEIIESVKLKDEEDLLELQMIDDMEFDKLIGRDMIEVIDEVRGEYNRTIEPKEQKTLNKKLMDIIEILTGNINEIYQVLAKLTTMNNAKDMLETVKMFVEATNKGEEAIREKRRLKSGMQIYS